MTCETKEENKMKALEKTKELKAISVYGCDAVDSIINSIRDEVRGFVFDVHTKKGRSEIASLAHKIARSKTALDSLGKDLVAEWKQKSRLVDEERKKIRDEFDKLKSEVRKPLDEWEAEQARLAEEKRLQEEIAEAWELALVENKAFDLQKELDRKEAEEKAKEAERIAKEEAKRLAKEQAEREERIKREAEVRAKREAEAAAQAEKERLEREAIEAKARELKAKQDAEEAAKRAEEEKQRAIIEAKERAEREAHEREQSRLRQEAEEKLKAEKKAANVAHQKKVNNETLKCLESIGLDTEVSKTLIKAIAQGKIKHVTINY